MTKQRIGLLATEMTSRGGIQSFTLRLIEVMGGLVNDNQVAGAICISLNDSTEALRQHPAMPVNVDVWGGNRSKLQFIIQSLKIKPKINTLIVGHLHLAPLALALKKLGIINKYFIILYGIEAWQQASFLQSKGLLGASKIIAISHFTATECANYNAIPIERFEIIPLCADERNINPSVNFKLTGSFKLLCVARQDKSERYKGFEQLFQALALLKDSHPAIHLNLIGNGNDQDRLKQVTFQLGITEQVTFWGALSDEELAAAYADCDVFTMPSKKEGFGIVFLEAMRFGKPCIGGNHGGTPEVIIHEESGFLVDYDDISALVKNISTLAYDPNLCIKMGKVSEKLVKRKFSILAFKSAYRSIIATN
jgi:phosphatidylinositol alpha-1,6-mannosyltransferase